MGEGKKRLLKMSTFQVCGDFLFQTKMEPQELILSSNEDNDRTGLNRYDNFEDTERQVSSVII